jgi:hypothetical protein
MGNDLKYVMDYFILLMSLTAYKDCTIYNFLGGFRVVQELHAQNVVAEVPRTKRTCMSSKKKRLMEERDLILH